MPSSKDEITMSHDHKSANVHRRSCTLIVTHRCNLNCRYCYEIHKSNRTMSVATAKEIVRRILTTSDCQEVVIDFLGGEPLMEFGLIREVAEWTWSQNWPLPYIMYATTNGTLLDDEMKDWFCAHRDRFYLGVSLDGTPQMQSTNRGCSYDDIDLDFFLQMWPDQGIKMTVSCETIGRLAQGIIYLQKKGFAVHANLGYGMPWNDQTITVFGQQLRELGEYYLSHPEIAPVSLLDVKLDHVLNKTRTKRKFCGTGTHMSTFDVDGTCYPCQMFTPLVMSCSQIAGLASVDFHDESAVVDPKCDECVLYPFCPTCYGFNYKYTGNIAIREPVMCRLFKVQVLECCRFEMQRFAAKEGTHDAHGLPQSESYLDRPRNTDAFHARRRLATARRLRERVCEALEARRSRFPLID